MEKRFHNLYSHQTLAWPNKKGRDIGTARKLKIRHYLGDLGTKGKVKCTLVQALRLCTGRTAHRGSRGMAVPFHDHGTRRG